MMKQLQLYLLFKSSGSGLLDLFISEFVIIPAMVIALAVFCDAGLAPSSS